MNRLIEWLRIDIILLRSSGLGCLILTFGAVASALTAFEIVNNANSNGKTTPEIATIVGFGAYQGSWHAGYVVVSARDPKGLTGTAMVQPSQIAGCHVGDKVRAGLYGLTLYLDPAPCPITLETREAETSAKKT
jgi:hypothetical protein